MEQKILRQRIIFRRLIQGLIIISIFLMGLNTINHENDIFWQLKMGEEIWENHHFPVKDPYSFPAQGSVWTLEEWLPATGFYLIFKHFGAPGLIILKAIVVATTFWIFLYLFNKMKVNLYLSIFTLFLAAMVNTRGVWVVFPSIFEYLFLVLALFLLEEYRKSRSTKILIFLAIFSLIWANSHASFFLLSGILAAYILGNLLVAYLRKRWAAYQPAAGYLERKELLSLSAVFLISLVTPLLTPNGYWTWLYPFRIAFGDFTYYVSEYQRFWTIWNWNWSDFVHGFTLILMIILGLFFIISIKRLHPGDFLVAAFFAILALTAVRHVAIFALVALFLLARYLKVWFGEYRGFFKRTLLKDILIIILIVFFVFFYKTRIIPFGFYLSEEGYPKQGAELLIENKIEGNMFNHYNYGGYLIWKMAPEGYKVFIDGRLEMYQGKLGQEYLAILEAREGWQELLEKYKINFFISYLTDPIVEILSESSDWRYIHHDGQYVVFVKNDPKNEAVLAKYWSPEKEEEFKKAYKPALAKFKAEYVHKEGLKAIKQKDILAAIGYFQEAIAFDPNFVTAHLNLARAYITFGLWGEAEREYQVVLEIEPDNQLAKKNLEKLKNLGELEGRL